MGVDGQNPKMWNSLNTLQKLPILRFSKHYCTFQFSSNFIQTLYRVSLSWGNTGYYFFGNLPKIKKLWHFSSRTIWSYFSHNFRWSSSKLYGNSGYHGKSPCLLEYYNEKLTLSTLDNILSKLFKNLVCRVFSSSRSSRPLGLLFLLFSDCGIF